MALIIDHCTLLNDHTCHATSTTNDSTLYASYSFMSCVTSKLAFIFIRMTLSKEITKRNKRFIHYMRHIENIEEEINI